MQNRPESSLNLCMIVRAQLKASSFTSPTPNQHPLFSWPLCSHSTFFYLKKNNKKKNPSNSFTVLYG